MKKYYKASLEYERSIFLNTHPELKNELLLNKTYCLKALGRYQEAYKNLLRANLFTNSDSINFVLRYEIALNAYLTNEFDVAYNQLQQLNHFIEGEDLKNQVAYLEILALNEMQKWDEAKEKLVKYNQTHDSNINVDSLYQFTKKTKIRSLKKTEALAAFAPGLVQVREGKPIHGITSAAIRGTLVYAVVKELSGHYFFSGAFTATAIYYLFYQGGVQYALTLTKQRNADKIERYNSGIRNVLLNNEMSMINH